MEEVMTRLARLSAVALFFAGQAALASAQGVPASFRDLQFLVAPGDRVVVVDATGAETKGRISELDGSTLSIKSGDGERRFREDDVVIIRQRQHDSVLNGVLIGAGVGAGLGLISELTCGALDEYCPYTGIVTIGSAMWGTFMGATIDLLHRTRRDVFRRAADPASKSLTVAPLVARRGAGAQVALRW
jgi:hypothetical protein